MKAGNKSIRLVRERKKKLFENCPQNEDKSFSERNQAADKKYSQTQSLPFRVLSCWSAPVEIEMFERVK